jgi:hypothetical protein
MSQRKQERRESISIEKDGRTYTGQLIISGTRKLRFTVEYRGKTHTDSRTWGTDSEELHNLRVMAEFHLIGLVFEAEKK